MLMPMTAGDLPHVLHYRHYRIGGQILKPVSLQRADPVTSGGLTYARHRAKGLTPRQGRQEAVASM